jgi:hypothetical protein
MRHTLPLIVVIAIGGCRGPTGSGPATTDTTSDAFPTLSAKIEFLERYVIFHRRYDSLDFHVEYHNNSGGWVPGPSDCYIRLVANVPADTLEQWIPEGAEKEASPPDLSWLNKVPGGNKAKTMEEWYVKGRTRVGIDRNRNMVAYNSAQY